MQIAFLNNYLYRRGGSESVMLEEADQLRVAGHAVALFGRADQRQPVELPNSDLFPPVVEFDQQRGLNKLRAARNVISNRDTGRRFGTFCDRVNPRVVHAHNIYAGLTTAVLDVCRARHIPRVITLHDYKLVCPSYRMLDHGQICRRCVGGGYHHCLRRACHKESRAASFVSTVEAYYNDRLGKYRQADRLIAPSRFMMQQMLDHGIPAEKLRCIPNGVDPARNEPCVEDGGYFLYLGRLSSEKGGRTLIEAAAGTTIPTRIVGEGPEKDSWMARARELGASNVTFEGYKSGNELTELMRGALAVVVPSEWYENASMAVLEAMAYGKPVIGANIGGIPEQVVNGETGVLFEPGNVNQLREALQTVAGDRVQRLAMGRAARARLEREFSLQKHCKELVRVYREVLN